MATFTAYTPSSLIGRGMFNFDEVGLPNFIITGPIRVSVSGPFYTTYTGDGPKDYWLYRSPYGYGEITSYKTKLIDAVESRLGIHSSFSDVFENYKHYANINFVSYAIYTNLNPNEVAQRSLSDINVAYFNKYLIDGNKIYFGVSGLSEDRIFGYHGGAGDIFLNQYYLGGVKTTTYRPGTDEYFVLMHELGHTLGLSHPHIGSPTQLSRDFSALVNAGFNQLGFRIDSPDDMNKSYFTVMSYDENSHVSEGHSVTIDPMILDVIALQEAYGSGSGTSGYGNDIINLSTRIAYWNSTEYDLGGVDTVTVRDASQGAYINLGVQISGARHLVGVVMTGKNYSTMYYGGDPTHLTWLYGAYENAEGSAYSDLLVGNSLNNVIIGAGGSDYIYGADGDDILIGGAGNDYLDGQSGTDTARYFGVRANYTITSKDQGFLVEGAEGTDLLLNIERIAFSDQVLSLNNLFDTTAPVVTGVSPNNRSTGIQISEAITITFSEPVKYGSGEIILKNSSGQIIERYAVGVSPYLQIAENALIITPKNSFDYGVEYSVDIPVNAITDLAGNKYSGLSEYRFTTIIGYRYDGTESDDYLRGTGGHDVLYGYGGHDLLDGGAGSNQLYGGDGTDAAFYRFYKSPISVDLTTGYAVKQDGLDYLHDIEDVFGSQSNDVLSGNVSNNYLSGESGNDFLSGMGGDDLLEGGDGNDILQGGDGYDIALYVQSIGSVTVDLGLGKSSGHHGDDLLSGIEGVVGGFGDDNLIGNIENNLLIGGPGNDFIVGLGGSDYLDGEAGNDYLRGASGDDYLVGGDGIDTASYYFERKDYVITKTHYGYTIQGEVEGLDRLAEIERLEFMGGEIFPLTSLGVEVDIVEPKVAKKNYFLLSMPALDQSITVTFTTLDSQNTATAGKDYIGVSETVSIAAGTTAFAFGVEILSNNYAEAAESLSAKVVIQLVGKPDVELVATHTILAHSGW